MRIAALAADRKAGQPMAAVFPHLRHLDLPDLVQTGEIDFSAHRPGVLRAAARARADAGLDGAAARAEGRGPVGRLPAARPGGLQELVQADHGAVELQKEAVYGLTEFYRDEISGGADRRQYRLQRRHDPAAAAPAAAGGA